MNFGLWCWWYWSEAGCILCTENVSSGRLSRGCHATGHHSGCYTRREVCFTSPYTDKSRSTGKPRKRDELFSIFLNLVGFAYIPLYLINNRQPEKPTEVMNYFQSFLRGPSQCTLCSRQPTRVEASTILLAPYPPKMCTDVACMPCCVTNAASVFLPSVWSASR